MGFQIKIFIITLYICVHACQYVYHVHLGAHEGQKRAWESLELELQEVVNHPVWILGIESQSSARVASTQFLSYLFSPFDGILNNVL